MQKPSLLLFGVVLALAMVTVAAGENIIQVFHLKIANKSPHLIKAPGQLPEPTPALEWAIYPQTAAPGEAFVLTATLNRTSEGSGRQLDQKFRFAVVAEGGEEEAELIVLDRIRMKIGPSLFLFLSTHTKSEVAYREPNKDGGPKDLSYLNVGIDILSRSNQH